MIMISFKEWFDKELLLEMAMGDVFRKRVPMDQNDADYLHQFPSHVWIKALRYRYNDLLDAAMDKNGEPKPEFANNRDVKILYEKLGPKGLDFDLRNLNPGSGRLAGFKLMSQHNANAILYGTNNKPGWILWSMRQNPALWSQVETTGRPDLVDQFLSAAKDDERRRALSPTKETPGPPAALQYNQVGGGRPRKDAMPVPKTAWTPSGERESPTKETGKIPIIPKDFRFVPQPKEPGKDYQLWCPNCMEKEIIGHIEGDPTRVIITDTMKREIRRDVLFGVEKALERIKNEKGLINVRHNYEPMSDPAEKEKIVQEIFEYMLKNTKRKEITDPKWRIKRSIEVTITMSQRDFGFGSKKHMMRTRKLLGKPTENIPLVYKRGRGRPRKDAYPTGPTQTQKTTSASPTWQLQNDPQWKNKEAV